MAEAQPSRIVALLARSPDQPAGDTRTGIELTVCLTGRGQLDPNACLETTGRIRRFWPDRPDWQGTLQHIDEGRWGLQAATNADEPLRELDAPIFRPGEYLTLRRPNGEELVFRIVSVENP